MHVHQWPYNYDDVCSSSDCQLVIILINCISYQIKLQHVGVITYFLCDNASGFNFMLFEYSSDTVKQQHLNTINNPLFTGTVVYVSVKRQFCLLVMVDT